MNPLNQAGIAELDRDEAKALELGGRKLRVTVNTPTTSAVEDWHGLAAIVADLFPRATNWLMERTRDSRVRAFEKQIVRIAQQVGATAVYMPFEIDRIIGTP